MRFAKILFFSVLILMASASAFADDTTFTWVPNASPTGFVLKDKDGKEVTYTVSAGKKKGAKHVTRHIKPPKGKEGDDINAEWTPTLSDSTSSGHHLTYIYNTEAMEKGKEPHYIRIDCPPKKDDEAADAKIEFVLNLDGVYVKTFNDTHAKQDAFIKKVKALFGL